MARVVGKHTLTEKLGSGNYGQVLLGVNNETQERVAVKVIKKEKIKGRGMSEMLKREITTMKRIDHPNVVKIYEVLATKTEIFIVMELVEGGDLLDLIERDGRISELDSMRYFSSIVQAVQVCHDNNVCHRDLKPENMMLTLDGQIKMTDFGMAVLEEQSSGSSILDTICGTPNYIAPEVLAGKGYDGKIADIWSLGCVLFIMMTGEFAFDGYRSKMFRDIQFGNHTPFPHDLSQGAKDFIEFILNPDPAARPSLSAIQKHPYFIESVQGDNGTGFVTSPITSPHNAPLNNSPPSINVFEIVLLGLGLDLASGFDANASPAVRGKDIRPRSLNQNTRRFITTRQPTSLLTELATVMEKIPGVTKTRVIPANFKLKGEMSQGMDTAVKFTTRIFTLLPAVQGGVYMVETTKFHGSGTKFSAFYNELLAHPDMAALMSLPPRRFPTLE